MASPPVLRFQRGLPQSRQFGERLRLFILQGADQGVAYCLVGDLLFIGREDCQIALLDENISKKHAEIHWDGDHYFIRDLGSSNGVVYNGEKTHEANLNPGDTLLIGMTVIKVLAAGHTSKNDALKATRVAEVKKEKTPEEKTSAKKQTEKKRLIVFAILGLLLYFAFTSSDSRKTNNEHAAIDLDDTAPKKKPTKKDLENAKDALKEFSPKYESDSPERRDADKFFHSGMRELQNKNYRRAINAFETALSVDPTHDLAKVYAASARKQLQEEVKSDFNTANQAKKSLRYKQARIYYESILRLLESEKEDPMYVKTQTEIEDLDKLENESK